MAMDAKIGRFLLLRRREHPLVRPRRHCRMREGGRRGRDRGAREAEHHEAVLGARALEEPGRRAPRDRHAPSISSWCDQPTTSPLQAREKLYLLAVGHYRNGDYPRSRQFLDQCLEIQPDCRQALALKKIVEDKIAKDGVIGIGIATTVIGVLIGIAAAVARKN
ncbi:hypothetical protein PVAP13_5KG763201 [Panicum virgatum]|uniref:Mitochondrial fission 1 protein n=1 Tax=Panicum virgatum TaxID=38727 RepID=A0A8T0SWT9_PANVG|nr:hypothetical protein PVAP13_5KG763201 [Panicum virgatum]